MKKEQRVERKKNREWICLYREAEDEIHALLHYCFFFNCLHYYFSLYICSLGRYYTENMLSFTLNIMLTDSLLLTNITNRMLTILIANLLTLGIIRTVDIFTIVTTQHKPTLKEKKLRNQEDKLNEINRKKKANAS